MLPIIQRSASARLVLWGGVLAVLVLMACGKKAPPVAPSKAPLVGVSDLEGGLKQGAVRLTWRHVPENAKAVGYIVLRAQSALSKPGCPECPQVYQKVGTVPIGRSFRRQGHPMEFYHDVAEGFIYTFNVRPYESSGGQGPDSNLVTINHPKE